MSEGLHEECGVFGIYSNEDIDIAQDIYLALYALQHRGQESAGIAVNCNGIIKSRKGEGLTPDVFNEKILDELSGANFGIGHVRYSPGQKSESNNTQPLVIRYIKGAMAIAANSAITNTSELKSRLEEGGAIFQTSSDAEIIAYIIARARIHSGSIEKAVIEAIKSVKGAYSLVMMSPQKLIAVRDPQGFRPLSIGKIGDSYCVASETCAFDSLGAEFVRDVEPGEVIMINEDGLHSYRDNCFGRSSTCVFEFVYFARPDSVIEGQSVHFARQNAGRFLAKNHAVDADIVIGVPDSGLDAALGYANESGIPYGIGFIKNRYVGRTFIQTKQKTREKSVGIKLNVLAAAVKGKRVVLVDDSIVRGTTSANIVQNLRAAGATEVHLRISSPPFLHPCYFGTDIDAREKLIAHKRSIESIRERIGADTLGYLSIDDIKQIAPDAKCSFCYACFTGDYPIKVLDEKYSDKYMAAIEK